jgi:uncharacterized protein YdeI (YjbR/CyaY-like superfamily)
MGKRDPRIDAYIAKQRDFAKPILSYIREVVHEGCPDCEETLKWSMPTFLHHGILCGMAGFKEYAVMMFWKGTLIVGTGGKSLEAMGSLGRITRVEDLPPRKELLGYIKKAMELNEKGITRKKRAPKPEVAVPKDLAAALRKNKKAGATFDGFSPSHRREYVEWITEAKTEATRQRRLETATGWMAEGKSRNWKYIPR